MLDENKKNATAATPPPTPSPPAKTRKVNFPANKRKMTLIMVENVSEQRVC